MDEITLDLAKLLLEKFDSISVIDTSGKYIYANQNWKNAFGISAERLKELHPWDILPNSQARTVLKTRKPIIGYPIKHDKKESFVSYYPLFKDDTFVGVLIWVVFRRMETALEFSNMVQRLSSELSRAKEQLKKVTYNNYDINNIIGESRATLQLKEDIATAANSNSTVLIEGETGVGKELVAHSIHGLSLRHNARFVRVNCSAIPAELMESEFFGYEEGAFTGAKRGGKPGKFELASEGSLFLDEINQMPLTMQPKFLRVMQEKEVERVGGQSVIPVHTRIIAATNIPLERLVQENQFREDLYYRLNVIRIRVPPLRERKEDIPLISQNLVNRLNVQIGLNISEIDPNIYDLFNRYDWPGNIRELQNVLEQAMNKASEDSLKLYHFRQFEEEKLQKKVQVAMPVSKAAFRSPAKEEDMHSAKNAMERDMIIKKLEDNHWNKKKTASDLGISRANLYQKIKKYDIEG